MKNTEVDRLISALEEVLEKGEGPLSETVRSLFIAEKLVSELEETLKDVAEKDERVRKALKKMRESIDRATSVISEAYVKAIKDLENDPEVQKEVERLLKKALGS